MQSRWFLWAAPVLFLACTPGGEPARASSPTAVPSPVAFASAPTPVATASSSAAAPVAASPAPNPPRGKSAPRVESRSFRTAALGVEKKFVAYLPRGYDDSAHRFPVAYYLHGLGGSETNWTSHGSLHKAAEALDLSMIVVMPDGDDSFYVNWPQAGNYEDCLKQKPPFDGSESPTTYCVRTPNYEDYVVRDLVAHIDGSLRTLPERRSRAIAGLSMGGFGAMQLAMRHTEVFSAVASHSGMLFLLGTSPAANPSKIQEAGALTGWGTQYQAKFHDHVAKVFGPSLDLWREHDPSAIASKLQPGSLAVMFDCGDKDGFNFQFHASHLHDVLRARGYEHEYAQLAGAHDWKYWSARVAVSLKFLAAKLEGAGSNP